MAGLRERALASALRGIDPKLASVFIPWAVRHPRYIRGFMRICMASRKASRIRREAEESGTKVPPFLILSVTSACNLSCRGCYAAASGIVPGCQGASCDIDTGKWRQIISEASSLGVVGFVIAGGEPFMINGIPALCREFPDRLFVIVTNGTAMSEADLRVLGKSSNIAVLVSIDGGREHTDPRRGKGVHERAAETLSRLIGEGVPSGMSATITRSNFGFWTDEGNVRKAIEDGARMGVFIEHIPVDGRDDREEPDGMLAPEERKEFRKAILGYRERLPFYIVHSPGDEDFFGGCVSAGRGFAHVTPEGLLTACPVSGFAVADLKTTSLEEGLRSPLFRYIRENHGMLETGDTPCALFDKGPELERISRELAKG